MRLTENQAAVYRFVLADELQAGAAADEAARIAYRFMLEDALPDWQSFWRGWNSPPGPLEQFMQAAVMLATMETIIRHPSIVERLGEQTRAAFGFVFGDAL